MKQKLALLLAFFLLLTGCGEGTPPESQEEIDFGHFQLNSSGSWEKRSESDASQPGEPEEAEEEPPVGVTGPAGLEGWIKPVKPTLEEIEAAEYWPPVFDYLMRCYYRSYVRDDAPIQGNSYRLEPHLFRLGAQAPGNTLTYPQYAELVELFWGVPAQATLEYLNGVTVETAVIDPQTQTARLDENEPHPMSIDGYQLQSIEHQDGVDEVTLTYLFSIHSSIVEKEPYQLLTYRLFWDEWSGYLPREISWVYTPTDRTSVEGDARLFPTLWGDDAPYAYSFNEDISSRIRSGIVAIGSAVYRFSVDGQVLIADVLDLDTLEQRENVTVFQMDGEILRAVPRYDGVILYSASTVVKLDKNLHETGRKPLPPAMDMEEANMLVVARDLSAIAYSTQEGMFRCELSEGAQPRLVKENFPGEIVDYEYPYPIQFLEDGRLYAGVGMWEASAGYYLLFDQQGNQLERMDYYTSGMVSGGFHSCNQERAIYYQWQENHVYNFAAGAMEDASWLEIDFGGFHTALPDPSRPSRWYYNTPSGERDFEPDQTGFIAVDFAGRTVTPLPVIVHGALAKPLAVSEAGHVLFLYSYRGEGSFGVFMTGLAAEE